MENSIKMPSMESVKKFRAKLDSPEGVFGPFMITADPAFVEAAGYAGYDFALLDMEHGPGTFENLQNLVRAANVAGLMTVVRVPRGMDIWIDQALDVGAGGIMIPQIDTPEQARVAVAAAKFSPRGSRGTCRFVRSAAYAAIPGARYFQEAQDTVVVIQAEGKRAIDNLDEILSVEGIDIVFVGPYDLSSSLGLIGQIEHPKVMEAIKDVVERAAKHNVKVGCFTDSAAFGRKLRAMGVKFVGYSCDTAIFLNAAMRDVEEFSKL